MSFAHRLFSFGALGLALSYQACAAPDSFQSKCTSDGIGKQITQLNSAATVYIVQFVTAGTNFTVPDSPPSCAVAAAVIPVDFCRVTMAVNTSSSSQFSMELWLPRDWSGRYLGTGNGGLNGCTALSLSPLLVPLTLSNSHRHRLHKPRLRHHVRLHNIRHKRRPQRHLRRTILPIPRHNRRLLLPRPPHRHRSGQGHHQCLLRQSLHKILLPRLQHRRAPRLQGNPGLPHRLRWRGRRRAGA